MVFPCESDGEGDWVAVGGFLHLQDVIKHLATEKDCWLCSKSFPGVPGVKKDRSTEVSGAPGNWMCSDRSKLPRQSRQLHTCSLQKERIHSGADPASRQRLSLKEKQTVILEWAREKKSGVHLVPISHCTGRLHDDLQKGRWCSAPRRCLSVLADVLSDEGTQLMQNHTQGPSNFMLF